MRYIWSKKIIPHAFYLRYFDDQFKTSYSIRVPVLSGNFNDHVYKMWDITEGQWRIFDSTTDGGYDFTTTPIGTVVWEGCNGFDKETYTVSTHTWDPEPNLTLTTDEDYVGCGFVIHDISIISLDSIQGAINYTVNVIAQSYNGITGYSINGVDYQVSNSFTLVAGSYIFYAKDAIGDVASMALTLAPISNYNSRWSFLFKDYEGNRHDCYILKLAYEGENEVLSKVGSTPIRIRYGKGGGEDIGNPILGSECILQLESETDRQFIDLTSNNPSTYRFEHYINGTLNWSGHIATDVYSESYTTPPYSVSVTFRDGLAELKDKDFLQANGEPFDGLVSEFFLIKEALKNTKLTLAFNTFINLFEENISEDSDPLTQIYLRSNAFYKKNGDPLSWHDVLKSILEKYYARVVQANGKWNIININEYVSDYDRIQYSSDGVLLGTENFDPVLNITTPDVTGEVIQWSNNDQSLDPVPAYSEVKIIHEIEKFQDIVKNGDFSEEEGIGFKYWTDIFGILKKETTFTGDESKTIAVVIGDGESAATPQYIQADQREIIDVASGVGFIVKVKFTLIPIHTLTVSYKVTFRLQLGPWYYDNVTEQWSLTESFIEFDQDDFVIGEPTEKQIKIPLVFIAAGVLDLRIYQGSTTTIGKEIEKTIIEKVSINMVGSVDPIPNNDEFIEVNSNGSQNAKFEKKIKWGDLRRFKNPSVRVINVMYNTDETLFTGEHITSGWKRGGTEDAYIPLLTMLANYYMTQYQDSSSRIAGKLYSTTLLNMVNSFIDPHAGDSPFLPTTMDINYKTCEYKVEMVQLKNYADERLSFRLLENGKKRLLESSGFAGIESARLLE